LPLRLPEAAQLANIVFDAAERKPLTPEVRSRIAARCAALRLETIRPYFGSLARDPIHHSSYYLAVDTETEPLLLHMALANAPTSAIFAKALLIGRMPRPSGPGVVINAIPFAAADAQNIARFTAHIDTAFLPRPRGSQATVVARIEEPASDLPAAFSAFQAVFKRTGRNVAAVVPAAAAGDPRAFHSAAVWCAVRWGWREGFAAVARIPADDRARQTIREAAAFSRFAIEVAAPELDTALETAARLHEAIRETRSAQKIAGPFDFELRMDPAGPPLTPARAAHCLSWLKTRGHAAQLLAPGNPPDLAEFAAVARQFQCGLSLSAPPPAPGRFSVESSVDAIEETAEALLG
jgi:hypothetical protein